MSSTVPDIGKVASGTSSTDFTVDPGGSVSVGAGGGEFIPPAASRSVTKQTVTITCSSGNNCKTNNVTVVITATGNNAHRLGTITGFAVTMGTAQFATGSAQSCTNCSSLTITLKPVTTGTSGSATFDLGMTAPVTTSGTLGAATSGYSVQASGTGYTTSTLRTATMRATVEGKLGITKGNDLQYGTIVMLGSSGTMTWDAATQTLSTSPSGLVIQKGSPTIASFTVTGTPSQLISFSLTGNAGLPNHITLGKNPGSGTLDITPSTTGQSSQPIGSLGTFTFYVGGTINISPSVTGHYQGTFTVTANYQ